MKIQTIQFRNTVYYIANSIEQLWSMQNIKYSQKSDNISIVYVLRIRLVFY